MPTIFARYADHAWILADAAFATLCVLVFTVAIVWLIVTLVANAVTVVKANLDV
jgi:hypothetical protein